MNRTAVLEKPVQRYRLALFLEKREAGFFVLGHFVSFWQCVDSVFARGTCEVVESDFLATTQLLEAAVEDIRLTGLFAIDCEWHVFFWVGVSYG